jgi:uncharacterized protein (DUF1810 family)
MTDDDPHDLERFVHAQRDTYAQALAELRAGRKRSHWMWFVFPQLAGLGHSGMARRYAIASLDEARAYLAHPVLGPRLVECARALLAIEGRTATQVLGSPDDLKLRSCATLFECVAPPGSPFAAVLDRFCGGGRDAATLALLDASGGRPRGAPWAR